MHPPPTHTDPWSPSFIHAAGVEHFDGVTVRWLQCDDGLRATVGNGDAAVPVRVTAVDARNWSRQLFTLNVYAAVKRAVLAYRERLGDVVA
jgi:hypothetical protein